MIGGGKYVVKFFILVVLVACSCAGCLSEKDDRLFYVVGMEAKLANFTRAELDEYFNDDEPDDVAFGVYCFRYRFENGYSLYATFSDNNDEAKPTAIKVTFDTVGQ